jgi:Cu/Ag efflux protein CusF
MKHVLRNLVIGAMLVAWTGLVNGQADSSTPKPPKRLKLEGEIVKVNADAKTIDVKVDGKPETLTLSEKFKVKINGEDKTLADLKPGDKVHLTCYEKKDGGKSVSQIKVGDDKPKDKETKPKT